MTDKKQDQQGRVWPNRPDNAGVRDQYPCTGYSTKDYNFVFHITDQDIAHFRQYCNVLANGSAKFAEIYYDYLFDNPDIADLLYSYERNGGDISEFIRKEFSFMVELFAEDGLTDRERILVQMGKFHLEMGIKPVWVCGAYRLFLEFLGELVLELGLESLASARLESALLKLVLRDLGLMTEGYWGTLLDTTRLELSHAAEQYTEIAQLLDGLPHLVWSVDVKRNSMICMNRSLQAMYPGDMKAPFPFLEDSNPEDHKALLHAWQEAVNGRQATAEARITLSGKPEHWHRLSMYPSLNGSRHAKLVYCILEDINNDVCERRKLEQMTTTDSLTQLTSKVLWLDHLNMALAASRRVPGSQVAVISMDINQFKMYNDTLGRDIGDSLLRDIAEMLKTVVRESDSLSRIGGDQFGILMQPVNDARAASERVISQILDSLERPFNCAGKQLYVSMTLGIACFPEHGINEEALIANAQAAMYRAKRNGLPFQYYDPVSDVSSAIQLRYSGQIQSALENNEFELFYQPQVDMNTSQISCAEALLRWKHPVEGLVLPRRIIPVAEQLGMIATITEWVILTALEQSRHWYNNGSMVTVSVNVSARSFQNPRLVDKICRALEITGVSGERLQVEITEAALMLDPKRAREALRQLAEYGVTVAIDDFGTGYSSLSYLKQLPIHTLKIDQSFIMDVAFDRQDIAIVRSIIDLGHNLEYRVVAEGVEHSMAWNMLSNLGCDAAQGYHISKPLEENQFSTWLSNSTGG